MTEIGMALSNPLHGERRPGFVGAPLPRMEAMLSDEHGTRIEDEGVQGEICVRGDTVFNEYWGKPEATRKAFRDGWFLTGDIALIDNNAYKILGRNSVDIIKSGGYKISALEIEEVLRTNRYHSKQQSDPRTFSLPLHAEHNTGESATDTKHCDLLAGWGGIVFDSHGHGKRQRNRPDVSEKLKSGKLVFRC